MTINNQFDEFEEEFIKNNRWLEEDNCKCKKCIYCIYSLIKEIEKYKRKYLYVV